MDMVRRVPCPRTLAAMVLSAGATKPGADPIAARRLRADTLMKVRRTVWTQLQRTNESPAGHPLDSLLHEDQPVTTTINEGLKCVIRTIIVMMTLLEVTGLIRRAGKACTTDRVAEPPSMATCEAAGMKTLPMSKTHRMKPSRAMARDPQVVVVEDGVNLAATTTMRTIVQGIVAEVGDETIQSSKMIDAYLGGAQCNGMLTRSTLISRAVGDSIHAMSMRTVATGLHTAVVATSTRPMISAIAASWMRLSAKVEALPQGVVHHRINRMTRTVMSISSAGRQVEVEPPCAGGAIAALSRSMDPLTTTTTSVQARGLRRMKMTTAQEAVSATHRWSGASSRAVAAVPQARMGMVLTRAAAKVRVVRAASCSKTLRLHQPEAAAIRWYNVSSCATGTALLARGT